MIDDELEDYAVVSFWLRIDSILILIGKSHICRLTFYQFPDRGIIHEYVLKHVNMC